MESQGIPTKNVTKCELLGKLMEDKLYAHHAIQDSLEVSDTEIYSYVDQSIEYFTEQLGSLEKVLELEMRSYPFYKNTYQDIKFLLDIQNLIECNLT